MLGNLVYNKMLRADVQPTADTYFAKDILAVEAASAYYLPNYM